MNNRSESGNHPIEDASFLSRCTFSYAYPLLKLGLQRPIEDKDLPNLHSLETSSNNRHLIESIWEAECKKDSPGTRSTDDGGHADDSHDDSGRGDGSKYPNNKQTRKKKSLGRALFWYYVRSTWWAQCLLAINMIARIAQAVVLGLLMEEFGRYEKSQHEHSHGVTSYINNNTTYNETFANNESEKTFRTDNIQIMYMYAALLVLCGFVAFPTKQQQFFETYRKGVQLRLGLISAIYAKTLRLPSINAVGDSTFNDKDVNSFTSSGHVTNLVSNDVERFSQASVVMPFLLHGPIIAVVILVVGIFMIGPVFAVGYVFLLMLLPLQVYLGRRFVHFRSQVASLTDKRVTLVSQAVSGCRVVKMNVRIIEEYFHVSLEKGYC